MADPGKPKSPPRPRIDLKRVASEPGAPAGGSEPGVRAGSETGEAKPRRKQEPTLLGIGIPPDPGDPTTDPDVSAPAAPAMAMPPMYEAPPDLLQTDHGVRPASIPPPVPGLHARDATQPVDVEQIEESIDVETAFDRPSVEQRRKAARGATMILLAGGAVVLLSIGGLAMWLSDGDDEAPVVDNASSTAGATKSEPTEEVPTKEVPTKEVPTKEVPAEAANPTAAPPATEPATSVSADGIELPPVPPSVRRLRPAQRERRAETVVHKANRLLRRGRFDRAEAGFRKALVFVPESPEVAYGMARALAGAERYDEALPWANRAVRLEPRNADPQVVLGDVLRHKGDLRGARTAYERAAQLDPSDSTIRRRLRRLRVAERAAQAR